MSIKPNSIVLIDVRDKNKLPETENIGLDSIATYLSKNGYVADLQVIDTSQPLSSEIERIGYDYLIYAFAIFHSNANYIYEIAKLIKSHSDEHLVCVGSRFATQYDKEIKSDCKFIDHVILGEGEDTMLNLLKSKTISQQHKKHDLLNEINFVSQIGRSNYILENWVSHDFIRSTQGRLSKFVRLFGKKGCTCTCNFCLLPNKKQRDIRKLMLRSTQDLFNEIVSLYKNDGIQTFMIHDCPFDDGGKLGIKRLEELCDLLISHPVKFSFECMIDGKFITNESEKLVDKMYQSGFNQIMYLIGSGNLHDENIIKQQSNIKKKELAIELFEKKGVEVMLEFFAYNPFSTQESFKENHEFLKRRKCYRLDYYLSKVPVYKETPLFLYCKEQGLLLKTYSYKNVFDYKCEQQYLNSVDKFYKNTVLNSRIVLEDFNFQNLIFMFNWMKGLFQYDVKELEVEIIAIKNTLHSCINDYFEIIMVKQNLENAIGCFESFEKELLAIYGKAKRMQMKMMRISPIRKYLMS